MTMRTKQKPTCHKLTLDAKAIRRLVKLSGKWVHQSEVTQRRLARISAKQGNKLTMAQSECGLGAIIQEDCARQLRDLLRTMGVTREDVLRICTRKKRSKK